jgi:hypothetical protein
MFKVETSKAPQRCRVSNHPHCLEPLEILRGIKFEASGCLIYSMQQWPDE